MIAYNHYIKFVPELENNKNVEGSFSDVITVQESSHVELDEELLYQLLFPKSQGRDLTLFSNREFNNSDKGKLWVFKVDSVVTFFWYSGTMKLEYIRYNNFTETLLRYWTLHVVLPTFFIIEGIYDFLHAGAVEVDEKPILFIAPSMGGKSTMTDYFMKQGHTMISDDKVATFQKDGKFYAVPSYSCHRPYRNMEDLGFFVDNFAHAPKIMHAIYALEGVERNKEVTIRQLSGIEKFKSLRNAKEMNLFFHESIQFDYLAKIAPKVLVFRVMVPWDLERLHEVYDMICTHSKGVK